MSFAKVCARVCVCVCVHVRDIEKSCKKIGRAREREGKKENFVQLCISVHSFHMLCTITK